MCRRTYEHNKWMPWNCINKCEKYLISCILACAVLCCVNAEQRTVNSTFAKTIITIPVFSIRRNEQNSIPSIISEQYVQQHHLIISASFFGTHHRSGCIRPSPFSYHRTQHNSVCAYDIRFSVHISRSLARARSNVCFSCCSVYGRHSFYLSRLSLSLLLLLFSLFSCIEAFRIFFMHTIEQCACVLCMPRGCGYFTHLLVRVRVFNEYFIAVFCCIDRLPSIFQQWHSFFKRVRSQPTITWCFFPFGIYLPMHWIYFVSFYFCTPKT